MSKDKILVDAHQGRLLTDYQLKGLVGNLKEIVEASVSNERQCEALKNVITDKVYEWYTKSQWWFTGEEINKLESDHIK